MIRGIVVGALALLMGAIALAADIDDTRLLAAATDPASWLTYGRDYGNQRFSPLSGIDASNVTRLAPRWLYQGGVRAPFRAPPLAADDPVRGRRVMGSTGVSANMAPLVYKSRVIVGITGVGYGLHLDSDRPGAPVGTVIGIAGQSGRAGFYAAFEAKTGKRLWKFDTTAAQGWEGRFRPTTPDGAPLDRDLERERATLARYEDAWKTGGGSAWTTPAIDPERRLVYLGVGNPSPQMDDLTRPGDNLYTVSVVAVDVDSGKLAWYYQEVPHDMWGYDVASPPVLFDAEVDGRSVPAVGQAGKTGWFYVLDRRDGRLLYRSEAFVPQHNLFRRPAPGGVEIAPGAGGGASWSPVSYDPRTGLVYVAGLHR